MRPSVFSAHASPTRPRQETPHGPHPPFFIPPRAAHRLEPPAMSGDAVVDVLVIGGGNAALCAALMAREAGARVLLLESAPRARRGGNSAHTRNLRCMHHAPQGGPG